MNFGNKLLENTSDEELYHQLNYSDPRMTSPISDELTRRALKHLDKTTSYYSKVLILLTAVLGFFTLIQIIFLIK